MKRRRGTSPIDEMYTWEDAARYLNITVRTLKVRTRAGVVPHYKMGGKVLYSEAQLLDYIESCKKEAK